MLFLFFYCRILFIFKTVTGFANVVSRKTKIAEHAVTHKGTLTGNDLITRDYSYIFILGVVVENNFVG